MNPERKPVFLLADSQPLFGTGSDSLLPVLRESLGVSERNVTKAAYIGASNGDAPEFYELFVAAMDGINLHQSRLIRSDFSSEDRAFLASADLLLLAGGDVDAGWQIMTSTGMDAVITRKYYDGAVLVGVSAGAMQLGMGWSGAGNASVAEGLKLVPYYIDVHSEQDDWSRLRKLIAAREEYAKGFGIPVGGAMIYHPDVSVEAVRLPVVELERSARDNGPVTGNLLLPVAPGAALGGAPGPLVKKHPIGECLS